MAIFVDNTSSQYALLPAITEPGSIPEPVCSLGEQSFTWGDKECPPPAGFEQIEAPEPYNYEQMSTQEKKDLMLEFFVLLKQIDFIQGQDVRALFVEDYEEYISFFENFPLELDLHNERSLLAQFYALNGITLSENEIKLQKGKLDIVLDKFNKKLVVNVPEQEGSIAQVYFLQTYRTGVYPDNIENIEFALGGQVINTGIGDKSDTIITSFVYSDAAKDEGFTLYPRDGKGTLDKSALKAVSVLSILPTGTVITWKADIPSTLTR